MMKAKAFRTVKKKSEESFFLIQVTQKFLSMCRSMDLMVTFGKGQPGRSEGFTDDCKLQLHRCFCSLCVMGRHSRSIQLEIDMVRVFVHLSPSSIFCFHIFSFFFF